MRIIGVLFCLALSGCSLPGKSTPAGPMTHPLLEKGAAAYLSGKHREAEQIFREAALQLPGEGHYVAKYWQGRATLLQFRPDDAAELFREVEGRSHEPGLKAQAACGLVAVARAKGEEENAAQRAEEVRRNYGREVDASWLSGTATRVAEPSGPGLHLVQVGLFSEKARSEALRRQLVAAGIETVVKRELRPEGERFVVQCGAFTTPSAAEQQAARLHAKGFPAIVRTTR